LKPKVSVRVTSTETVSFYSDARVYDILHGPGTLDDLKMLERVERIAARAGRAKSGRVAVLKPSRTWLEPACGSGRYLIAVAKRGRKVIGFDLEPAMIDYCNACAAKLVPAERRRCTFAVADMTDFAAIAPKGSVSFAFNLINTIRHLPTDAAMVAHLKQVKAALQRGGVYVVGLSLSAYGLETATEDVWSGKRGATTVTQVVQYEPPVGLRGGSRVERVFSVVTVKSPKGEEQFSSTYGLRTYSRAQWERVIERAGMRVARIVDGDGHDHEPGALGYAIWVLTAK
jgi:SAM-dependent methyltransferase